MAFKKSLSALVFALPLVLGLNVKRATTTLNPKCDFLKPIADDLLDNLFTNECGDAAHGALRLVFHDAIGIDPIAGGGGADGSILTFNATELAFPANDGLDDVLDDVGPFFLKYQDVLSPGDFVQFAGALSLAACPGAPQVQFLLGRPQPKAASPPNLVPEPFDDVTTILARMNAAGGFSPQEVVALLSSHTVAGADTVDPTIPGTPFDSTPSVFDTQIFIDVLLKGFLFPGTAGNQGEVMSAINGTLRLQSDDLIARDSRTACFWQDLATNHASMEEQFGAAVFKLSLLGQNAKDLTDCSEIIPTPPSLNDEPTFPPGQTIKDIQQSCAEAPFPNLPTQPGPPLDVPAIPQAETGDDS
jgi:cytochrome c peroxidase